MLQEISNHEYHSGIGVSVSGLKLLARSPLHYWAAYVDPARQEKPQTTAQMIGSAVHCAALEPAEFAHRYAVLPDGCDRRTTAGKAIFAELEASGKILLKPDQYDQVMSTADAIRRHPAASLLLANQAGQAEGSLFWNDDGVLCKARPDWCITPCEEFPNGIILDVKTTEDAASQAFAKSAYSYGYHMQAAWYSDGFQRVFETPEPPAFLFVAVEKEHPHGCAVYAASVEQIALGRQQYRRLLALYAKCESSKNWPGYSNTITPLPLPAWAEKLEEIV